MKLEFRDGLLFTSVKIIFQGKEKIIKNVIIDTGAAESIISPDVVEDIGIEAKISDSVNSFYGVGGDLHTFFSKEVDSVEIEGNRINNVKMDFGIIDPTEGINGLLGLDLLIKLHAVIDLKKLKIQFEI